MKLKYEGVSADAGLPVLVLATMWLKELLSPQDEASSSGKTS